MVNEEIRKYAEKKNVRLWQIANAIGINDGNFSRKLRVELSDEEKNRINGIIDEIAEKRGE